jgi:hypothetical protein
VYVCMCVCVCACAYVAHLRINCHHELTTNMQAVNTTTCRRRLTVNSKTLVHWRGVNRAKRYNKAYFVVGRSRCRRASRTEVCKRLLSAVEREVVGTVVPAPVCVCVCVCVCV